MNLPNQPDRWLTALSDKRVNNIHIDHIFDDGDLVARVTWRLDLISQLWLRMRFKDYLCYRLVREELSIGEMTNAVNPSVGPTVQYSESKWLREIRHETPDIDKSWAPLRHFILVANDRQLEVVTSAEPIVEIAD